MNKDFIPFELALELKQIGFDEPCFKYTYTGDTGNNIDIPCEVVPSSAKNYNEDDLCVSTPTYSQAFRWFREKYNLGAIVSYFGYAIENQYGQATKFEEDRNHLSYEELELACLRKLIEIVKKKQNGRSS
jgi:hypothetical protein